MKIKNKRGQAFLITTVILIMILIAFITIANYSKKTNFSTFPFSAEEIQIESEKVMDYSLLNNDPYVIEEFTKNVSNYLDKDTKIYFITGETPNFEFYTYENNNKQILNSNMAITDKITITIEGVDYYFEIPKGKAFYFIMIKENKGEKYVYTNA